MNHTAPSSKHLRFDIDPEIYKTAFVELEYKPYIEVQIGRNINSDTHWIGVVWRINYFIAGTNKDVIGYLGENKVTVLSVENKEKDLEVIKKFISNAFLNVEIYLLEKLAGRIQIAPFLSRASIDGLAQQILLFLDELGYYKK
ncbi:hypothetical protein IDJ77_06445 [Mucilaginibacter sp. ZT4R22]|uniref:YbjN domain-containing protein n=1 Tax=Mucilaginibacter pankratovii TaxID=2772110 RepID=A0ABR7WM81_9SPHI|nr:hypothetical protein [Mucilaginibacter pankratovii]MBD1363443.1 hypothetical protein [Mucilaginibacter pankratovii]